MRLPQRHQRGCSEQWIKTVPIGFKPAWLVIPVQRVGWNTIKSIFKQHLSRRFSKPTLGKLKDIAIDEISIRKGYKYSTLVTNLESGVAVFVGEGRNMDSLASFWRRLKRTKAKIQAVATDMNTGDINSVRENLKNAVLVFDQFHVVKLMNDKITQIRRQLFREISSLMEKKAVKGTHWLLLKTPENLDASRNKKQRLDKRLRLNKPLATATI